jgi:DNA modification methylase
MSNDNFIDFLTAAFTNACETLKEGCPFYIWYASSRYSEFKQAIINAGLTEKQQLIWNKNTFTLGRQDHQWKHEPCFYGWKEGAPHKWYGGRNKTTVYEYDKPNASRLHPTMKPVGLIAEQISNSTQKGDIVLDIFGGSGTTLIACEQLNRKCLTMEIDPRFVDVIVKRWEELTEREVVLVNG